MTTILNIETSTKLCSASLSEDGVIVKNLEYKLGLSHATKLLVFVEDLLKTLRDNHQKLDAVAISAGPGSYTGLRIGVSTAKGLCYGFNIPLISINTLDLIAHNAIDQLKAQNSVLEKQALICPMLDARRMEVYTALYTMKGEQIMPYHALILDHMEVKADLSLGDDMPSPSIFDYSKSHKIYVCGNGASKVGDLIPSTPLHDIEAKAEKMGTLAQMKFEASDFENVAYFEPFYLKNFQVTTSKKKLF